METWVLYLLVSVLILGNILFITLFILSVARNNKIEEDMRQSLIERLGKNESYVKTEYDKNVKQPIDARPQPYGNNKYQIVEARHKSGWYVRRKGEEENLAFAKSKEEAQEIIKDLARNS